MGDQAYFIIIVRPLRTVNSSISITWLSVRYVQAVALLLESGLDSAIFSTSVTYDDVLVSFKFPSSYLTSILVVFSLLIDKGV